MLGRHNITLYADELERCMGDMKRLCAESRTDAESCYWLGALNALSMIYSPDMPDDHIAMASALAMHFNLEQEGKKDA